MDLRTAQQLLGHASIEMTARIYTHLEAEDGLKVSGKLDDISTLSRLPQNALHESVGRFLLLFKAQSVAPLGILEQGGGT